MKKILIILLLMAMMLTSACTSDKAEIPKKVEGATDNVEKASENKTMAPDFELKDMEGNTVKLSDFLGKKVMINFWATWCKYCVEEMPDLMKLQEAHKDDLVVLFVNVGESKDTVQKFIDKEKLTGTVLLDENKDVASLYGVDAYPTTFAINEKGEAVTYFKGILSYDLMEQMYKVIK